MPAEKGLQLILDDETKFPFTPGLVEREINLAVKNSDSKTDWKISAKWAETVSSYILGNFKGILDIHRFENILGGNLSKCNYDIWKSYLFVTNIGRDVNGMLQAYHEIEARAKPEIKEAVRASSLEFLRKFGEYQPACSCNIRDLVNKIIGEHAQGDNDAITTTLIVNYADLFQIARSGAMKHAVDASVNYFITSTQDSRQGNESRTLYDYDRKPLDIQELVGFEVPQVQIKK